MTYREPPSSRLTFSLPLFLSLSQTAMSTSAHVDLGAPIGDGSQFDSTKPIETGPAPAQLIQDQAQAQAAPPPPSPSPPLPSPPPPPPKDDVPPSPVRPQKEWETRLTPSLESPAPSDNGSTVRSAAPTVVADEEVVPPIDQKDHAIELEKKAAEKREIHGHPPVGTIVVGIEDDRLWAGLRRFDKVTFFSPSITLASYGLELIDFFYHYCFLPAANQPRPLTSSRFASRRTRPSTLSPAYRALQLGSHPIQPRETLRYCWNLWNSIFKGDVSSHGLESGGKASHGSFLRCEFRVF